MPSLDTLDTLLIYMFATSDFSRYAPLNVIYTPPRFPFFLVSVNYRRRSRAVNREHYRARSRIAPVFLRRAR
jgi:hypothetical protein